MTQDQIRAIAAQLAHTWHTDREAVIQALTLPATPRTAHLMLVIGVALASELGDRERGAFLQRLLNPYPVTAPPCYVD